jgi:uncharacterized protein YbcI
MSCTVDAGARYRKRLRGWRLNEQRELGGRQTAERWDAGPTAAAVSNAVVSLYAEYLGRGPTRAKTAFGRDVVTVVLEETLTKAERRLVQEGQEEPVLTTRRVFQQTMRKDLVAAVERITGRRVVAFLSDQATTPDVAVEVFVLEPALDGSGVDH